MATDAMLHTFLHEVTALGIPGCALTILRDGKTVFSAAAGTRDADGKIPMDGKELLNLYSCSKPVTCAAALQLLEQGRIRLEDPLWAYLPEFREMSVRDGDVVRPAKTEITLLHLFTMTAGFNYDAALFAPMQARDPRCPTVETVRSLAAFPLDFEPGTAWQYSFCHDVLAAVVEIVSGERFSCYVRRHIFEPLGMECSTFLLPEERLCEVAPQYAWLGGRLVFCGPRIQRYQAGPSYESGGAGLVSTAEDYLRFLEALRLGGGGILRPETVDLMLRDRLDSRTRLTYWYDDYGYGLGVRVPLPGKIPADFGWGGAAGAYLMVDTQRRLTSFFTMHVLMPPDKERCRLLLRSSVTDFADSL